MQVSELKNLAGRVASYELFAVLALGLIVLARPQWGVVAPGLLAVLWAMRWLSAGRWSVRTPLDWCNLGLLLALPASLWISADLRTSMAETARLLVGMGLFYALVNSAVRGWRFALAVGLVIAGGAGLALLGLLGATHSGSQVLGLPQQLIDLKLPFAIHANVLATALVLILPLAAALTLWQVPPSWPRWSRPAIAAALLVMVLALVLTQSRGAFAGLLTAAVVMILLRWRRARWLVLLVLVLGGVAVIIAPDPLLQPVVAGILGRESVWLRSLFAIRDFPYSGLGFGLFDRLVPILYPYFVLGTGPLAHPPHAHNLYLQIAVDVGLPGLASFLALLLAAAGLVGWLWRHGDDESRALAWGVAGSLVAMTAHGLVDAGAWASKVGPLLWMLLGLLAVLPQRQTRRLSET